VKSGRELELISGLEKSDCLADIIDNNLARITTLQVLLKRIADTGVYIAVDVLVERGE
jgi:hypothetical protein